MKVKLYMDDLRPCPEGWILARDGKEMLKLMKEHNNNISCISLDHDLGHPTNDGYWVVKGIIELGYHADKVYLHTANPLGRENMYKYLECAIREGAAKPMRLYYGPCMMDEDECGGNGTDF